MSRAYEIFGKILLVFIGFMTQTACLPDVLQKYRRDSSTHDEKSGNNSAAAPGSDIQMMGPAPISKMTNQSGQGSPVMGGTGASARKSDNNGQKTTIYAVDKQTFRFLVREEEVWNAAIDVLLKNYNLNIVERGSGIITTEWDSFFLNNGVFRNKVSVRIRKVQPGIVDVTVLNNVERLRDASTAGGGVGAVWLPAQDVANEMARLVQNMALALNQPLPVMPTSQVATWGGVNNGVNSNNGVNGNGSDMPSKREPALPHSDSVLDR